MSCADFSLLRSLSQVINVSKKWLGETMATAFEDPRLTLRIDDAAEYLKGLGGAGNYDVIICDSSDPVGPAAVLFELPFFQDMKANLSPTGILCTQGECLWLHLDLIESVLKQTRSICAHAKYAYTTIPSYPSGQIGFILGTADETNEIRCPRSEPTPSMGLRYYSKAIHEAAFVLPAFAQEKLA